MLRFILDQTILDELPDGWDDLDTTLRTDRTLLSVRVRVFDAKLTFYRDGLRYLRQVNAAGCCGEVRLTIEEDPQDAQLWTTLFRGVIKLPAARWSYEPDLVTVSVEDAGWYAYLNNNKSLEVPLDLPLTKNGRPLTPPTLHNYTLLNPDPLVPTTVTRGLYHLDEVLAYLTTYLSDGQVDFYSAALGPLGPYAGYAIQTGYRLRTTFVDQLDLRPSLVGLLQELAKNFHLALALEDTGARPRLRLEPEEYFRGSAVVLQLDEVHPITVQADTQRLYASVKVGSDKTTPQAGFLQFPETTRWRGYATEQYYLLGQCNIDTELDLVRSYVVSSNSIENTVFQNDSAYDEDVFLLQVDRATGLAVQDNWLTPTPGAPLYFNPDLTNEATVRRWLSGVPASLATELGAVPSGTFRATTALTYAGVLDENTTTNTVAPVRFADDFTAPNFDQGNVYGNGTAPGGSVSQADSRFTAPVAGAYDLSVSLPVRGTVVRFSYGKLVLDFTPVIKRYDSGNVLQDVTTGPTLTLDFRALADNNFCEYFTADINLYGTVAMSVVGAPFNANDYAVVEVVVTSSSQGTCAAAPDYDFNYYLLDSGIFACTQAPDFGNFTELVDCGTVPSQLVKFRTPLRRPELQALLDQPTGRVVVRTQERTWTGWLEQLKYDHGSGLADVTLLTAPNLLP